MARLLTSWLPNIPPMPFPEEGAIISHKNIRPSLCSRDSHPLFQSREAQVKVRSWQWSQLQSQAGRHLSLSFQTPRTWSLPQAIAKTTMLPHKR